VAIAHADGISQVSLDFSEDNIWVKKGNYRCRKGVGSITITTKAANGPVAVQTIGLIKTDSRGVAPTL